VTSEEIKMMRIAIAVFFSLAPVAGAAPIYRCTSAGAVSYQEQPCESAGARVALPDSYPEVNRVERDRLLQREAALDARLLKRLELEAAERIARDHRRALEAQAERDRARPVEPAYVVPFAAPFVPRPPRAWRRYHSALIPRY
jgi:hypothetical protein